MPDYTPQFPQVKTIPLTKGKVAIVDAADYEWLSQWKWFARKRGNTWYAFRAVFAPDLKKKQRLVRMHRVILGDSPASIDHIDGDGLNNTRNNLRACSHQENCFNRRAFSSNTSGYKGVTWDKVRRKWQSQIMINGKHKHLGRFDNPVDAARAYDAAAKELHGKFAQVNLE